MAVLIARPGDADNVGGARARDPDVSAVFAASDLMAAEALGVLACEDRVVLADVALVGFEDSSIARLTDPPLTSVAQPLEAMSRTMAELLIRRIEGDRECRREILPTTLVVRGSSQAA